MAGLYLLVGVLLAVYSLKDLYGIIELRAMLSAVILFFAIPRRVIHCVEEDIPEREEDSFAREDVRALANHQLEDFSDAFRRLSKSFENEMEEKGLSEERLEDILHSYLVIRATNVSIVNIAGTAIMRRPMKVCDRFCGRWGRTEV